MRRHFFFIFLALLVYRCGEVSTDRKAIKVVTTTSIIGDAMKAMIDSTFEVKALMGPGTDPHLFKPTKQSLDDLASADIIVANGLHLEGRMQDILEKMARKKPVILIGEGLQEKELIQTEGTSDYPDPHIWFDVALWKTSLEIAAQRLAELRVLDSARAGDYLEKLEELNKFVKEEMSSIPQENRVLLTAHDAFSYFGRAYDVEVIGLQGISTAAEYGLKDVEVMVDLILNKRVKAVFVESSISSRSMEAVISGVRYKGGQVSLGGTLYSDAPGVEGSGAESYIQMVKHNVKTIKTALK
jgi:manganese/zinc/iron transport system substrate-binding protein